MRRIYLGYLTVGRADVLVKRIIRVVQTLKLTRVVPHVKTEKKPRRQFYIFIAVDDIYNPEIDKIPKLAGLTGKQLRLVPDEIKTMVGRAEIETHGTSSLIYKLLWSDDAGDPFNLSEVSTNEEDLFDSDLCEHYNQLLYWLSITAEGSWENFARVCKVLHLVKDIKEARYIFRRLILLGHIECKEDGSRWSVCPSTLVLCPSSNTCFLCGQRTPKILKQLMNNFTIQFTEQPGSLGPTCIKVDCDSIFEKNLELFQDEFSFQMVGPVCLRLAELIPNLEGWKSLLTQIDRLNTSNYIIEKWDGREFSVADLYERNGRYIGESGMYCLKQKNSPLNFSMVLYFDRESQSWLKGDWYGLQFLTLNNAKPNLEVCFNSKSDMLFIPVKERWPLLYERSLVLATGLLPSRSHNSDLLKYHSDINLVKILTSKLNVSIKEVS